ncbi:MAG: hypothetical protein LBR79_02310 [Oscillospiraceae bacterium]|jgi:hypothetical protein|nr:hypothetical protein [Oscillospiraceae bacterium]
MAKKTNIFDILADEEKVKKIATFQTKEEVLEYLKSEGVEATEENIKALGNIFNKASKEGAEAIKEEDFESVGGGKVNWKIVIFGTIAATIGAVVFVDHKVCGGHNRKRLSEEACEAACDMARGAAIGVATWFDKKDDDSLEFQ